MLTHAVPPCREILSGADRGTAAGSVALQSPALEMIWQRLHTPGRDGDGDWDQMTCKVELGGLAQGQCCHCTASTPGADVTPSLHHLLPYLGVY